MLFTKFNFAVMLDALVIDSFEFFISLKDKGYSVTFEMNWTSSVCLKNEIATNEEKHNSVPLYCTNNWKKYICMVVCYSTQIFQYLVTHINEVSSMTFTANKKNCHFLRIRTNCFFTFNSSWSNHKRRSYLTELFISLAYFKMPIKNESILSQPLKMVLNSHNLKLDNLNQKYGILFGFIWNHSCK
jgi:hypothetical protein